MKANASFSDSLSVYMFSAKFNCAVNLKDINDECEEMALKLRRNAESKLNRFSIDDLIDLIEPII